MDDKKKHWDAIYSTKPSDKLSWTQERPSPSIEWIMEAFPDRAVGIIDVGGGTSLLVDHLLDAGYLMPAVIDISSSALRQAKDRLGKRDTLVDWHEGDITTHQPSRKFALWHDRAVFHFLTRRQYREKYIKVLQKSLAPKGKVILATFSPQGPGQCSGLDVMRFDEHTLSSELGSDFELVRSERRTHVTPWGDSQDFVYCLFSLR